MKNTTPKFGRWIALIWIGACGGSNDGTVDATTTADAASGGDARVTDASTATLLGRWRRTGAVVPDAQSAFGPHGGPGSPNEELSFGTENTSSYDQLETWGPDWDDHLIGDYEVAGDVISFQTEVDADNIAFKFLFSHTIIADALAGDLLIHAAASPEGAHDGVVGLWRLEARTEIYDNGVFVRAEGGATELRLTEEGNEAVLTRHLTDSDVSLTASGYWRYIGPNSYQFVGLRDDGAWEILAFRHFDQGVLGCWSHMVSFSQSEPDASMLLPQCHERVLN